ncbi:hypothetical protein ACFE04_021298 [Oxalis oulophora]
MSNSDTANGVTNGNGVLIDPRQQQNNNNVVVKKPPFSTVSVSVRGGGNSTSFNSTSSVSTIDHKPLLGPTPFILGKRVRAMDDNNSSSKDDYCVTPTMGSIVGPAATQGGFWLPARPDFGQLWSFAAPEMVVQQGAVAVSHSQQQSLFVQQQHHQVAAVAAMGEASAARVGNYLPGHLNLLASLSGGGQGNSGRRDDDHR